MTAEEREGLIEVIENIAGDVADARYGPDIEELPGRLYRMADDIISDAVDSIMALIDELPDEDGESE